MSRLTLIECAEVRRSPTLPWALLSASLSKLPHQRIQCHPFALRDLSVRPTTRLVLLDTGFPVGEAAAFAGACDPVPVVLYGPYALDRFEQVPVRAAMIGPARDELFLLGTLATRSAVGLTTGDLQQIPRLVVREGTGEDERWTFPTPGPFRTAETILRPFQPRFDWEFVGPRRRKDSGPALSFPLWWPTRTEGAPSIEERDAARQPLRPDETAPPERRFDPRWDEQAVIALGKWLDQYPGGDLFPLESASPDETLDLLIEQGRGLLKLGHRSLHVPARDPIRLLGPWLRELLRVHDRPSEVVLSPSVAVLRRSEGIRQELLGAAQLVDRLVLADIEFGSFDDRGLRLRGQKETHWDLRWVSRLLAELDGAMGGRIATTTRHRLALFDPWTEPRGLLDSLVAIEEDAPFLKPHVHPGSFLSVPSRHDGMGRRISAAGALRPGPTTSGWHFEFLDPRMSELLGLAQQGLGPLAEGIGRLRLAPRERERALDEARFRWMRQLAEIYDSDASGAVEGWGKVLAGVTREVSLDVRRPSP